MYKRYFRRNESKGGADSAEWIEMTGREYYRFITDPQNSERYFVDMGDVVLECSKSEYRKFKAEDDHSSYLLEQEANWVTQSLECLGKESRRSGEDLIADISQDVEAETIARIDTKALHHALAQLDDKSYRLIYSLYLSDERMTERAFAKASVVSQNAIHKQKKRILKILKLWVVKFQKSSQ